MTLEEILKAQKFTDAEIENIKKVQAGEEVEDFDINAVIAAKEKFKNENYLNSRKDELLAEEKKNLSAKLMQSIYAPINETHKAAIESGILTAEEVEGKDTKEVQKLLIERTNELKTNLSLVDNSELDEKVKALNAKLLESQKKENELSQLVKQKESEKEEAIKTERQKIEDERIDTQRSTAILNEVNNRKKYGFADEETAEKIIVCLNAYMQKKGIEFVKNEGGTFIPQVKGGSGFPLNDDESENLTSIDQVIEASAKAYNQLKNKHSDNSQPGANEEMIGGKRVEMVGSKFMDDFFSGKTKKN